MAYFLKKSYLKKGLYLQIYESFYDPKKKNTAHKSFKSLGYVDNLITPDIPDPETYYREVVNKMNLEAKDLKEQETNKQIGESPERFIGYFPLQNIYQNLSVSNYLDLMQSVRKFRFRISDLIEALVYSRVIDPCSKLKTCHDILPKLYEFFDLSYDQILDGTEYIGNEYEKIIEIFNHQVNLKYPFNTSKTYFDCTNFYFEIDKEDDFRRKGPSKENRKDPIVGMGLLLDANQIPMGMKMYPGNKSEKPLLREVIKELKERNQISGRTIQVADKGLNCGDNVVEAVKNKDGYIFSKSVKQLPEIEQEWVLLKNGYKDFFDENGDLAFKIKSCVDEFSYVFTLDNGTKRTVKLKEKRVVTFNPNLAKKKKLEIKKMIEKAKRMTPSQAKKNQLGESSKYISFEVIDKEGEDLDGEVKVTINKDAIDRDLKLAGYNLIVTSEVKMKEKDIYDTYHNLWRIEETFKAMKSYLDSRPAFVQKIATIHGHFLICYLSILLLRLLQFKVLKNNYSTEGLIKFIRDFRVVQTDRNKYINLMSTSVVVRNLSKEFNLPITNYFLNRAQIKKMLKNKINL